MTEVGLDPLAGYTPPYEAAQRGTPLTARYPLALIAGADHYFLVEVERLPQEAEAACGFSRILPDGPHPLPVREHHG